MRTMRSASVVFLLASVAWAEHKLSEDKISDELADKLVDKLVSKLTSNLHRRTSDLDDSTLAKASAGTSAQTTLGKPTNLVALSRPTPTRTNLRPPVPLRNQARSSLYNHDSSAHWAVHKTRRGDGFVVHAEGDDAGSDFQSRLDKLKGGTKDASKGFGASEAEEEKETAAAEVPEGPEETFYEGAPAITETLLPTLSIPTLVGIIPAVASWSRQVWVKFTITNKRVKVVSGFGGNDETDFTYKEIVKIRSVKRLLGDGDIVFTLARKGDNQIELRHVPNFDEAVAFMLKYIRPDVVEEYKKSASGPQPR
eukprot:gnl/TRDRNA2_/TRDRNA2_183536_c0_seq1.p1 gnl/TRDRNA2_/TRDRNA2_183536_c0~~gnl/TRDRNA2_/TRDRNA2_183536_c0_seq1.p1  ORF type:complete len:310 (-),score=41.05 gnl/TRDRNA2_/TRDRNA2_183536_c0_seq1:160-1089(-)